MKNNILLLKHKYPSSRPRQSTAMWICLLAACIGASWFAIQTILIPQPRQFTPDWHDARWVQASDNVSPVAYFRYEARFEVMPDSAFVTVTASQVFRLYINGIYIGTNRMDFVSEGVLQTYMFDVSSALHGKVNVVGLRVTNVDKGIPLVRATLAALWGNQMRYYGTDSSWKATGQTTLVYPRSGKTLYDWSKPHFDASQWPIAQIVEPPPLSPPLIVNPLVYERPLPTHWLSAGLGQEGYFVRQFTVPAGFDDALLRIVAAGEADIFINNHLYMKWDGQVDVPQDNVVDYLDTKPHNGQSAPYRNGLLLGVYDISPYLHAGTNTIAVHTLAPGATTAKVGLDTLKNAMSIDMLLESAGTSSNPLALDASWHASTQAEAGWMLANSTALNWPTPSPVGRPGASHAYYLPDSNTSRNVQVIPPLLLLRVVACCSAVVLALWLFLMQVLRRYYPSVWEAREAASLVFLPALAFEAMLIVLIRDPQIPPPFPYTWQWGLVLTAILGVSGLVLWRHAKRQVYDQDKGYLYRKDHDNRQSRKNWYFKIKAWLKDNWGLVVILLLAVPMVCYDLGYEPYWQDELASYYAARNILTHGYPGFPSGFVYPKAELYSYILALVMSIFGTTSKIVPRTVSVMWYLLSLPLLYLVASKLFNRRVGWLATAMLAFSPYAMIWARQTRMYEQAQLMVIVVLFMFFWALQHREQIRPVYLAVLSLLAAYFSHEEVFIILPAILICVLASSAEGPYGIPAVLRKKHWWIAALFAIMVIGTQLSLVFLTHPPVIGSDQSRRPQIQLTTDNIPYYFSLLFIPKSVKDSPVPWVMAQPLLLVNSLLALLGCVLASCRKQDANARYCALFLLVSSCTLIFLFTMQADRYYYPLLPVYYMMGAYAFWKILDVVWRFARPLLLQPRRDYHSRSLECLPLPVSIVVRGTAALLCAVVLLVPMLPVSNFNLFASRIIGVPYHRHYADYDDAAWYMNRHMQQGDIVITVAPAVTILYYVGHVEDFFSIDRALFLIEQNGRMVETATGAHPLLNEEDFETVLAMHNRIWLVTDNGGYQGGVTRNGRFIFPPPDFRLVYEGYGSGVYFRSADG